MEDVGDWDEEQGGGEPEAQHPAHLPAPWETDDYGADEEGVRRRHDAFTPARKKAFLKALAKTGCILDACRETGVSSRTVYDHQGKDYDFLKHCTLAINMAGTTVELMAWERGVTGIEEEVVRYGKVYTQTKRSDSILRLLLQGANPKKYGSRPGFTRKRLLQHERKEIERQVRAEMRSKLVASDEEICASLAKRLKAFGVRTEAEEERAKLAEGWTRNEEGQWVPPGYARLATGGSAAAAEPGENSDSM